MKKIFYIILCLVLISCTDNHRARSYGGTETIKLKPNEKFINITWKETSLWIITEDTLTNTIYCREKSSFGLMEGQIIINY